MPAIDDGLAEVMRVRGALCAGLIDHPSGTVIGALGTGPAGDPHAPCQGAAQIAAATVHAAGLARSGRPSTVDDVVVRAGNGYHIIAFVDPGVDSQLALYLWLDPDAGDLTVAQDALRSVAMTLTAV